MSSRSGGQLPAHTQLSRHRSRPLSQQALLPPALASVGQQVSNLCCGLCAGLLALPGYGAELQLLAAHLALGTRWALDSPPEKWDSSNSARCQTRSQHTASGLAPDGPA